MTKVTSVGFYNFTTTKTNYFLSSLMLCDEDKSVFNNLPFAWKEKGKSMSNRKLKGSTDKASSHFHDFLKLKASCLEACYRSDIRLGLHLLALKAFLYVRHAEVVLSNLSARSPYGFKNNYFDNKNLNSIRQRNFFYSKHEQNKHPGRTRFSSRSLEIIYWTQT